MTWWLGYAKAGKEFEVEQAAKELGVFAWVPRKYEAKRVGKKRKPQIVERPYFGNVVFLDLTDREWHDVQSVRHLSSTMHILNKRDVTEMHRFRAMIDAEQEAFLKARANNEALAEYSPGQSVNLAKGPFAGTIAKFKRLVENSFDLHPKYEVEAELFGQTISMQVDPLDVKAEG